MSLLTFEPNSERIMLAHRRLAAAYARQEGAEVPVVEAVAESHAAIMGRPAKVGTLFPQVFYGTDASHLLHAGIPTVIYGPGKVADINVPNESMAIADFLAAARVYLMSASRICARH